MSTKGIIILLGHVANVNQAFYSLSRLISFLLCDFPFPTTEPAVFGEVHDIVL